MPAGRTSQFVGALVAQQRTSSHTSTLRNLLVAATATAGIYGIVTHVNPGELNTAPRRLKVCLMIEEAGCLVVHRHAPRRNTLVPTLIDCSKQAAHYAR